MEMLSDIDEIFLGDGAGIDALYIIREVPLDFLEGFCETLRIPTVTRVEFGARFPLGFA